MATAKILFVEDEEPIRMVLAMRAERLQYDVQTAENGVSGMEVARSFLPDLVVTDQKMPGGVTGMDLIKALKGDPGRDHVPFILLTGSVVAEYTLSVELEGLENIVVVPKPFSLRTLFEFIEQVLKETYGADNFSDDS